MQLFMIIISALVGINGLLYIFYPTWRVEFDHRLYNSSPNGLRLLGLVFLLLAALFLYYIFITK